MKLYFHPASTTSRIVLLFAAEEGIELKPEVVDILSGAHLSGSFPSVNPKRLVPALEDDGFIVSESAAILRYLAAKTGSAAYPTDLRERARVDEMVDYLNSDFYRDWGYNLIYPQLFPHHKRDSDAAQQCTVHWGQERVRNGLAYLDSVLASRRHLAGDKLTIADYFGAGILSAGELIRVDLTQYPNLNRWYESMRALPSWPRVSEALEGFKGMLKDTPFVSIP
ncbi:MAG TPA: glutathione S-transferase family protein [Aromatoleum sp.]|uniref:glutathione S-transferase family protein n=1 Tax=Aromatoleum sp. TaxID=2307007 RepID=UPI002B481B59|nr:glutathione S-transferase family protein [Aromatoleum sp.]HJV25994.1 glutathione S-transferase family protein [Aromatoleum sp.]